MMRAFRDRLRRQPSVWVPAVSLVVGLGLWWALDALKVISPVLFAGPVQVGRSLAGLAASGELWLHLSVSGQEFAAGYGAAAVLGILLGHLLARNQTLETIFSPYLIALYSAPRVAFIMIVLAWFGTDLLAKAILVFLGAFFPVCINVLTGAKLVGPELIKAARVFGATPTEIFVKVSFPFTLPYMFTGLRLAVGRALIGVFVAEMYGSGAGIGALISRAGAFVNAAELLAGVLVLAVASVLLTEGVRLLGAALMRWQPDVDV